MAFDEIQFPTGISYGSEGGPEWQTDVVVVNSGHEFRNQNWADPLYRYNARHGVRTKADLDSVKDFFIARQGMSRGFRYKDWVDYQASSEAMASTGGPSWQAQRTYTSGTQSYIRNLTKPTSTGSITRNGGNYTNYTMSTQTGIATVGADSTQDITNITQANPGVVTSSAHGFSNGNEIHITGVAGMTEVNNKTQVIAGVTADTFQIEDTTSFTAYTSGGVAGKYIQSTEAMLWTGGI